MAKIKVEKKGHPLNGLWNWSCDYHLDEGAFSTTVKKDIEDKTNLIFGSLGDWWVFDNANPILPWSDLIQLAINILSCKATSIFVSGLYIEHKINLKFINLDKPLSVTSISGAKRVNARSGDYTDYSEVVGLNALKSIMTGIEGKTKEVKLNKNLFRLFGKDESCCVEGTWLDWCMFACNILASENTKLICPEIYAPGMENDNY